VKRCKDARGILSRTGYRVTVRLVGRAEPRIAGAYALAFATLLAHCVSSEAAPSCPTAGALVVVSTGDHRLTLCDAGRMIASYRVALGRGGTKKRARGDDRTPLGAYAVGEPRASTRFGMFIPIAYPTAEQRQQGYTGSEIGIHGPDRRLRWMGRANTWLDWTAGCVALSSDADVNAVASFVQRSRPSIVIR